MPDIRLTVCVGLPKDTWELSQRLGRGGRDGHNAAFVIMLWAGQAGGRGQCKDLGRLLLERKIERQSCQRAAVNSLFQVDNPNKYYSSEAMEEGCSDTCELEKMCVCTMCKCCSNCANKCRCSYANVGFDESLAQHLLPSTSVIYQTVKEETEGWIALEDDDDDDDDDEEEEEEEEEEENTDAYSDEGTLDVIYELF